MAESHEAGRVSKGLSAAWPWLILGVVAFAAVWHFVHFPDDADVEFPKVARPTFSLRPPPAYRLAEPGDTIDRVAIYVSSLAIVLASSGWLGANASRGRWTAAWLLAVAGFWVAANPSPTFGGWHGLGFAAILDPGSPAWLRFALAAFAMMVVGGVIAGVGRRSANWAGLCREARERGLTGLVGVAVGGSLFRFSGVLDVEPYGYWPRWAFAGALVAFAAVLVKIGFVSSGAGFRARLRPGVVGGLLWLGLVASGIELSWYHRPLERLREIAPGRIFISAMPSRRGLEIAQARHGFRTIINLFPEGGLGRSPKSPEEMAFAREHGIRYVESPPEVAKSNAFLDETLRLAQDPAAWPILVHCHACMDRTPAWVGIYRFVVEGRPLDEVMRFIEGHRGYRPKASVTLLYNRVLPRLALERAAADPSAAILRDSARGVVDPYEGSLRAEAEGAKARGGMGGKAQVEAVSAGRLPSLTPRR